MASSNERVRVAQIGLGYWGPNLLRNLRNLPSVDVGTVADINPERLVSLDRSGPPIRTTTDVDDVFDDPTIQAVVIATLAATRFELAQRTLMGSAGTICTVADRRPSWNDEDLKFGWHCGRVLRIGQDIDLSVANGETIGLTRFAGRGPTLCSNVLDDMFRYPEVRQIFYLPAVQLLHVVGVRIGDHSGQPRQAIGDVSPIVEHRRFQ